ncbi:MAG: hypothetical protein IJ681_09500 [Bacteroidales bacterium]|nr:hypothetical protein [Bacteroidales bacterium]
MAKKTKKEEPKVIFHAIDADKGVEKLLTSLYRLQKIESEIDKIRKVRGELPEQVKLLEDTIEGLNTRITKQNEQQQECRDRIAEHNQAITEHKAAIAKFETQLNKVKNIRDHDSIAKEIEFEQLEIELCEKRIREANNEIEAINRTVKEAEDKLAQKENDLEHKKTELESIVKETSEQEEKLLNIQLKEEAALSEEPKGERYLQAFKRIRGNARNGLAVVKVDRDACGGCFNKVTHQRQMDIQMHKKILVCEYCGRILVDDAIAEEVDNEEQFN